MEKLDQRVEVIKISMNREIQNLTEDEYDKNKHKRRTRDSTEQ